MVGSSFNPLTPAEPPLPTTDVALTPAIRRRRKVYGLIAVAMLVTGCREGFGGFGSGTRARAAADQLFAAITDRFTNPIRAPRYESARRRVSRSALSPSRAFDDTATWTSSVGASRFLEAGGAFADGRYVLVSRHGVPAPARSADARHFIALTQLDESEYRWDSEVTFALGTIRPADVATVIARFIASGEGRTDRELRANLAATAPHTSAALGALFTLDTLRPTVLPDGSTAVTVGVALHAEQIRPRFPAFADYLKKYVEPARFHFVLSDRARVPFLDVTGKDHFFTVRLRTQHGHMVPLFGPARPMPDTLLLEADMTMKLKIFNVGFHDLQLEFVNGARGDLERDWTITARREPQWNLPFITARLLRAPLRRPFSGDGSMFRIGVRAGEGGMPTVLERQARLYVQESAILNFLNGLSSTALDEFSGTVEKEEAEWLRELFVGLREDAPAAIPGP